MANNTGLMEGSGYQMVNKLEVSTTMSKLRENSTRFQLFRTKRITILKASLRKITEQEKSNKHKKFTKRTRKLDNKLFNNKDREKWKDKKFTRTLVK